MIRIRQPAVAGMFYPADPTELHRVIDSMLDKAKLTDRKPKALIAPHAGYIYSGPVAASGYILLRNIKQSIRQIVLLGPSHRVAFRGLAVSSADQYATPLGNIPIDKPAVKKLLQLEFVAEIDQAHEQEHSLEVHLPFLQSVLNDFTLVPIVAGDASPSQVCEVLDLLWGESETLIIVSSDLSHYHDYDTAQTMDRRTSTAIENLNWQSIESDSACGKVAVNGLLAAARKHHLKAQTIDLRNSGDTAGPRDRVVGYGTYAFQ